MGDCGEVVEWYGMGPDPGAGLRLGASQTHLLGRGGHGGAGDDLSDVDEPEGGVNLKYGGAAVASSRPGKSLRLSLAQPRHRVTREAEVMASAIGDVVVGVHVSVSTSGSGRLPVSLSLCFKFKLVRLHASPVPCAVLSLPH